MQCERKHAKGYLLLLLGRLHGSTSRVSQGAATDEELAQEPALLYQHGRRERYQQQAI